MPETMTMPADPETGEIQEARRPVQMSLDPDLFATVKRETVPMVKVSFSGSVEMPRRHFEALCDEQLAPGRQVTLTVTGYVPAPHAKWVKRTEGRGEDKEVTWEREGQVPIKVTTMGPIEVGLEYHDEE